MNDKPDDLTLLDWFAGQVIASTPAPTMHEWGSAERYMAEAKHRAVWAYAQAQALLDEREERANL